MSSSVGSTQATVRPGETAQATIQLQGGPVIAKAFLIHFARDSAFIEPPMRPVLRQVAEYAAAHPKEKLLIVGHTDLTGSAEYNQSLSERRARSVFAFLSYGCDSNMAVAEWNALRMKRRPGDLASINDSWGVREYQFMLQDLGYYVGDIDEHHGPKTTLGVAGFQRDNELVVTGSVNSDESATWKEIIKKYLAGYGDIPIISQDRLVKYQPNAQEEINAKPLKWLGCGELDPVKNTQDAWRPNRRVECLFVPVDILSVMVARPVTYDRVAEGGHSYFDTDNDKTAWGQDANRCGFTVREQRQSMPESHQWLIQSAETQQVLVNVRITHEDGTTLISNAKFALIASDGEYLHTDTNGNPALGEKPSGKQGGSPIWNTTDVYGNFSFPQQKLAGIYTLELPDLRKYGSEAVLKVSQPGRGNVVYQHLEAISLSASLGNSGIAQAFGIEAKILSRPESPNVTIKGRIFWNCSWDRSGGNLPSSHKEYLPGAKVELFIHNSGETSLVLTGIAKTSFLSDSEPLGLFEFKDVPQISTLKLRIYLEDKNGLVKIQGGKNKNIGTDFEIKEAQVISYELDLVNWQTLDSGSLERDYGDIAIMYQPFVIPCDTYKSIWWAQLRISSLTKLTKMILCTAKYPADADSFNPYNSCLNITEDSATIRDVVLHEFGHFIVRSYLDYNWFMWFSTYDQRIIYGYEYKDAIGSSLHKTDSKEHYEIAWIEGLANFFNGVIQDVPNLDAYGVNLEKANPTDVGPHSEGSIQEALWQLYINLRRNPLYEDDSMEHIWDHFEHGIWKTLADTSIHKTLSSIFDFFNRWKDLEITGLDKLIEALNRSNIQYGYTYYDGMNMFTAIACPTHPNTDSFYKESKQFWSVEKLFEYFGKDDLGRGSLEEYKEEFYNRNKFLVTPTPLAPHSTHINPSITVGQKYIVPKRFRVNAFQLTFTTNKPPFDERVNFSRIEGILNTDRTNVNCKKLIGKQSQSLFRVRADLPGTEEKSITATLTPTQPQDIVIEPPLESLNLELKRQGDTDRFVSHPILAIPSAILLQELCLDTEESDVQTQPDSCMQVIRCAAGGSIRLEPLEAFPGAGTDNIQVGGRIAYLYVQNLSYVDPLEAIESGATASVLQFQIEQANLIWSQVGIEVRGRYIGESLAPIELLELKDGGELNLFILPQIQQEDLITRIEHPTQGIDANPTRSCFSRDINTYCISTFLDQQSQYKNVAGHAYVDHQTIAIMGAAIAKNRANKIDVRYRGSHTLAHELGHFFLGGWPLPNRHKNLSGNDWDSGNVMHFRTVQWLIHDDEIDAPSISVNIDISQAENILRSDEDGKLTFLVRA